MRRSSELGFPQLAGQSSCPPPALPSPAEERSAEHRGSPGEDGAGAAQGSPRVRRPKRGVGWDLRLLQTPRKPGKLPRFFPEGGQTGPHPARPRPAPPRPATCAVRPCSSSSWPLRTRRSLSMALLPAPLAAPLAGPRCRPRTRNPEPHVTGHPGRRLRRFPAARACALGPRGPGWECVPVGAAVVGPGARAQRAAVAAVTVSYLLEFRQSGCTAIAVG